MRMPASVASVLAVPLVAALTQPIAAQAPTGRSMSLAAPVVIGHTASFAMSHPAAAAGNAYALLWSAPFAGVTQVVVPGLTVQGLARIDPASFVTAFSGVLGVSGFIAHSLAVPNDPFLVGYALDLQGIDLEGATATLRLADNELTPHVAGTIPSNMVEIAAGSFLMGSNATTGAPHFSQAIERPVHLVTISRPFWIGRYEVTQAEYEALTLGNNPSLFRDPSRPVETVMGSEAMGYCSALTAREAAAGRLPTGYCYRLPTEAEWEYCCRAGTTTEYSFGDSLGCGQASFGYITCGNFSTAPVGSHAPNAWGLHDMHGNVWEICLDSWDGTANYPSSPVVDPWVSSGPYHVFRGGGYGDQAQHCRSAVRTGSVPSYSTGDLGFRVVLAPVLTP